ncbi:MAG: hypothetical protein KDE47_06880, partial [Caldilineaceae bacterium]|nr:hypothetical protein [Caldilineaceae bacterium]
MSLLRFGAPFSMIWLLSIASNFVSDEKWGPLLFYLMLIAVIAYASIAIKLTYTVRTFITLLIIYALGTADLIFFGVAEDWRLHYAALLMCTTIFLGRRAGFVALLICLVSFISIGWLISKGVLVITMSIMDSPIPDTEAIFMMSMVFFFVCSMIIMVLASVLEEFENAWERERLTAQQLSIQTKELESSLSREQLLANKLEHSLTQQEELNRLKSR